MLDQIFDLADFDICALRAVAFRTQVVAGNNHIVKYRGTDCGNDPEDFFFLVSIYEPLPYTGEAAEVLAVSEEVLEDSPVPDDF